jgi:hypothetical protein
MRNQQDGTRKPAGESLGGDMSGVNGFLRVRPDMESALLAIEAYKSISTEELIERAKLRLGASKIKVMDRALAIALLIGSPKLECAADLEKHSTAD